MFKLSCNQLVLLVSIYKLEKVISSEGEDWGFTQFWHVSIWVQLFVKWLMRRRRISRVPWTLGCAVPSKHMLASQSVIAGRG